MYGFFILFELIIVASKDKKQRLTLRSAFYFSEYLFCYLVTSRHKRAYKTDHRRYGGYDCNKDQYRAPAVFIGYRAENCRCGGRSNIAKCIKQCRKSADIAEFSYAERNYACNKVTVTINSTDNNNKAQDKRHNSRLFIRQNASAQENSKHGKHYGYCGKSALQNT